MLQPLLSTVWLQEPCVRNVSSIAQYWLAPVRLRKKHIHLLGTGWLQEPCARKVTHIASTGCQYWLAPRLEQEILNPWLSKKCYMHCPILVGSRKLELEMLHALLSIGWLQEALAWNVIHITSIGWLQEALAWNVIHITSIGWLQEALAWNVIHITSTGWLEEALAWNVIHIASTGWLQEA
jgi:uncharacterized protein (DUF486 family)